MEIRFVPDAIRYPRLNTDELRAGYLIESLFVPGIVVVTAVWRFGFDRVG
jgi:5-keto 4-deoxyuronate isomerase